MKKYLALFILFISLSTVSGAQAKNPTVKDVNEIGFNILESNKIQKRMVFKNTSEIKNPRLILDYKPESIGLDYTGRIIWVYGDVLSSTDNNDELAGLLSYGIAMAENSYKGLFRGFFSHASYLAGSKRKETDADIKAVDYMVKAGYNPLALITIYSKTPAQTRYEWCHLQPLATKRMINIYEHIANNYPQYLANNAYANNIYYKNFLHNTTKEMKKLEKKMSKKNRAI